MIADLLFGAEEDNLREKIEKELKHLIRSSQDAKELASLAEFNESYVASKGWPLKAARAHLIANVGSASILNRIHDVPHVIRESLYKGNYYMPNAAYVLDHINHWFSGPSLSTEVAIQERQVTVDKMAKEYTLFLNTTKPNDIDEWVSEIPNSQSLVKYAKHILGEELYMDALLVFLQQYSMADVGIYIKSPKGTLTKRTQTGFSLAYYGDPGTGKSFATDDLLRGNTRQNIPAHGIIGKLRYAEGMTPKQFIAILEAYQDYPVDWIIPEFRDFFRYQGMVEKLKLVMERREVSDETRNTQIGPYKVTSFFVVNYNLKLTRNGYKDTMADPNFAAVEDRMICKLFVNTKTRDEIIFQNMLRRGKGELEYYLADTLRKHISYSYHYLTQNKPKVILDMSQFEELGTWIIEQKNKYAPKTSMRILDRALQIAASSALVSALNVRDPEIHIDSKDMALAKEFVSEELVSRSMKSS